MKILGFPWTIRTRLTVLYAGAFFLAGAALVGFVYIYLGQVLDRQFVVRLGTGLDSGALAPGPPPPLAGEPDTNVVRLLVRQARLDTLQTMLLASLGLVGVMSVIAAAIGWFVAGQALEPLRRITATARRVADRSLHERIAIAGPNDEIKTLADTLDEMLERLDKSFDSQRRFVANASHELRTPLTIARTLIEVALLDDKADEKTRQLGTTLLAVNERHEKLTDGLLTLASSEQRADFHPVDIADVARHAVAELTPMAERAGVRLDATVAAATIMADAVLLERLIQNLVENGIQYNSPREGWVRITTVRRGGDVELTVENAGPVIAPHEVPGLFEPFRRMAANERLSSASPGAAVRGAGLGLSIVRAVAESHGGTVEAVPRAGGGLVVRVRLPALP